MSFQSKVSIIINCYNGEKYLSQAIDSIYQQSYKDWQIVFFDNCSTDNSAEIAQSYDERLIYFRNDTTIPLGHARKKALEMARGDWIAFLDCDDLWLPEKLEEQMEVISRGEYSLCYAGIETINESGQKISESVPKYESGYIFPKLLDQFDINMVTPIMSKAFLERNALNFDPNITASEEYNLFMRMSAKSEVAIIPKVLGKYRVYSDSLTNKNMEKWSFERRYTLKQILADNPELESTYSDEFEEAFARADYYDAVYQMAQGDYKTANNTLLKISKLSKKYKALFYLSRFPTLWGLAHDRKIKLFLSKFLNH